MQRWLVIVCAMSLLQACSLYRKPEVPAVDAPEKFNYARKQIATYKSPLKNDWWMNFNDQHLNQLVELSYQRNYDYLVAIKNMEIARTYIAQNASMWWPQLNVNADLSRNHSINIFNNSSDFDGTNGSNSGLPGSGNTYNLGQLFATVSYEIDIWNQIGNSVHQAVADTTASAAASQVVKLTLLNSIVDQYYQIATLNNTLINLSEQRMAAAKILQLVRAQYRAGLVDGAVVEDAKIQLDTIKSNWQALRKQKNISYTTLAYLVGEYPEKFDKRITRSTFTLDYEKLLPQALPSQMLVERPDIQQAYFQVLSAGYVEKQMYANFFPSFALTGTYGYSSTTLSTLVNGESKFWNYGLNVVQPLFDYQLRTSQYQRAQLQYQGAILNYRKVVLNAFKEVNIALTTYQNDRKTLEAYQRQYRNNAAKLAIARAQYRSGLTDYASYLTLKLSYLQSQYTTVNQRLLVLQDILQVYKTLGLGLCTNGRLG